MASGGTLKGITIEIGGNTTELTKALSKVGKEARDAGAELRDVNKSLKFNPENLELLAQREKYATEQADALRKRLDLVNQALSSGQVAQGSKQFDRLRRDFIDTTDRIKKLDKAAEEARDAIRRIGEGGGEAAQGVEKVGDAMQDAAKKSEELGFVAQGALLSIGENALGIAQDMASSVFESAEAFDTSSARIEASLGSASDRAEEFAEVGRALYTDGWGDSMEGVTDAVIAASEVLGDVSDEDLSTVTEAAMGLEEVFGSDISESVRAVDVLMERFGVSAQEATDLLVAGAQRGLDYTDELGDNIAEYSGRWGDAGVSASQYFSLLQAGVDAGAYSLDRVGDYLNEFLTSLSDGRMASSIGSLSAGTQAVWESYQAGGASALDMLNAVVGDLEDCESATERATVASELWGTLGEDNAMSVILALGDVEDSYGNVEGASEDLASTMEDTFDKRMASSVRSLQEAFEPLALAGMDALTGLLEFAEPAIEAFASLDEEAQKAIVSMIAIAPAVTKAAKVLRSLGSVKSAVSGVATAVKGVSAAIGGLPTLIAGLGLTAVTVAVADMARTISETNAAIEEAAEQQEDYRLATEGVAGAIAELDASGVEEAAEATSSLSDGMGRSAESAQSFRDRMVAALDESRGKASEAAQGFRDMAQRMAEVDASANQVRGYAQTIEELRDTTGLAEEDQARLETAARRFNEATGASVTVIDAQNGKLSDTAERIDAICDAYIREAQAAAIQEQLTSLYSQQLDQMADVEQAANDLAEAQVRMWESTYGEDIAERLGVTREFLVALAAEKDGIEIIDEQLAMLGPAYESVLESQRLNTGATGEYAEALGAARENMATYQGYLDGTNESIAFYEGKLREATEAQEDGADTLEELTDGTDGVGESAEDAANHLEELNEGLRGALEGARGAVDGIDGLAGSLEDASKTAEGAGDAIEKMFSSANDEGADITELTRDVNEALKEAGVTTDDLAEEMVLLMYNTGMTGDEVVSFADDWQKATDAQEEAEEALEETREAMGDLVDEYPAVASAIEATGQSVDGFATYLSDAGSSVDEFRDRFESLADVANPMQTIEQQTGVYTWSMRDNMQANIDTANQWADNMKTLYSKVSNEQEYAFAQYVESLGPAYQEFLYYLLYDADVSFSELAMKYDEAMRTQADAAVEVSEYSADTAARVGTDTMEAGSEAIEQSASESAKGATDAMADGIEEGASGVVSSVDILGEQAMDALMELPSEMRARGEAAGGYLAMGIAQGSANIGPGVQSIVATIAAELVALPENLGTVGRVSGGSLAGGISSASMSVGTATASLVAACSAALVSFPSNLGTVGTTGGQRFASGISSTSWNAQSAAGSLVSAVASGLSNFQANMSTIGLNGGAAFANGVQYQMGAAYSSAWMLAGAALSAMQSFRSSAYASGAEMAGNFAAGIGSMYNTVALAASSIASAVSDRLHFSEPKLGPLVGINDSGAEMVSNYASSMLSEMPVLASASDAVASAARLDGFAGEPYLPSQAQDALASGRAAGREASGGGLSAVEVYDAVRSAIETAIGEDGVAVYVDGRKLSAALAGHMNEQLGRLETRRSR